MLHGEPLNLLRVLRKPNQSVIEFESKRKGFLLGLQRFHMDNVQYLLKKSPLHGFQLKLLDRFFSERSNKD